MQRKTVKKRKFPLVKLAACLFTCILIAIYLPLYNQLGVHSLNMGFLSLTEDGVYENAAGKITVQDGTLTFDNGLSPLTVTEEDGFYTVTQQDEILYSGRMPAENDDRRILEDGTIVTPSESESGYPLLLSRIIALSQGQSETRGNQHQMTIGMAALIIWIVDVLFPNFFYRVDFRSIGGRGAPSATYRKIQKVLRIILPLWALAFLAMSLL